MTAASPLDTGLSDAECLAAYDARFGAAGPRGTKRKRPGAIKITSSQVTLGHIEPPFSTALTKKHSQQTTRIEKLRTKANKSAKPKKVGRPAVFKHSLSTNAHNRRRRQQRAAAAPERRYAAASRALKTLSKHAQDVLPSHNSAESLMQSGDSLTFEHVLASGNRFFDCSGEKQHFSFLVQR